MNFFYKMRQILLKNMSAFLLQNATFMKKWICTLENFGLCDKSILYFQFYFVLTLTLGIAVLYGNVALSMAELSNEKRYSNFKGRALVFQKTCLKSKVCVMLKISYHYYLKTCQSIKQRTILKTPNTTF